MIWNVLNQLLYPATEEVAELIKDVSCGVVIGAVRQTRQRHPMNARGSRDFHHRYDPTIAKLQICNQFF
jgi:hypothetical protein